MLKITNRLIIFTFLVVFILVLTSCEYGIEIVNVELGKFPNRIVYIAGVDKELDMSGSTVLTTLRQGDVIEENFYDEALDIKHNIDFNTPGVYEVELCHGKSISRFPVQVIDKSYIDKALE